MRLLIVVVLGVSFFFLPIPKASRRHRHNFSRWPQKRAKKGGGLKKIKNKKAGGKENTEPGGKLFRQGPHRYRHHQHHQRRHEQREQQQQLQQVADRQTDGGGRHKAVSPPLPHQHNTRSRAAPLGARMGGAGTRGDGRGGAEECERLGQGKGAGSPLVADMGKRRLEEGRHTQIDSGPKCKTWTKCQASVDIIENIFGEPFYMEP